MSWIYLSVCISISSSMSVCMNSYTYLAIIYLCLNEYLRLHKPVTSKRRLGGGASTAKASISRRASNQGVKWEFSFFLLLISLLPSLKKKKKKKRSTSRFFLEYYMILFPVFFTLIISALSLKNTGDICIISKCKFFCYVPKQT